MQKLALIGLFYFFFALRNYLKDCSKSFVFIIAYYDEERGRAVMLFDAKDFATDKNNNVDFSKILEFCNEYQAPKKTKRGVSFKAFSHQLGSEKIANIASPAGHITIMVDSQFWKMIRHKEDRRNVLFNIKETLKNPLFISVDKDSSVKFFNMLRKPNGEAFIMCSICRDAEGDGRLALMTNYQIRNFAKLSAFLLERRGEVSYIRGDIAPKLLIQENSISKRSESNVARDIISKSSEISQTAIIHKPLNYENNASFSMFKAGNSEEIEIITEPSVRDIKESVTSAINAANALAMPNRNIDYKEPDISPKPTISPRV